MKPLMKTLRRVEAENIVERLVFFNQNRTATAKSLMISDRGLRYKLKRIENDYPDLLEDIRINKPVINREILDEPELYWKMPTTEERIKYLNNPTFREC
jgi:hypothetical protein